MEVLGKPDELHNGAKEAESPKGDIFLSQDQIRDINFHLKEFNEKVAVSQEARAWLDEHMDEEYFKQTIKLRGIYVKTKLAEADYGYSVASQATLKLISRLSSGAELDERRINELEEPFEDFVRLVSGVEHPFEHKWEQKDIDNTRQRVGDLWRPDEPNKFPNRWRDRKTMGELVDAIDTKKLGWLVDVEVVYVDPLVEFGVLLRESIAERANLEFDITDAVISCANRYTYIAIKLLQECGETEPKQIGTRFYSLSSSIHCMEHLVAFDEEEGKEVHFIDSQLLDYSRARHAFLGDCIQFLQDILTSQQ